jgi:uracil-DNA glycosylase
MDVKIEESWKRHIGEEFDKQYFIDLTSFVRQEYMHVTCYPPAKLIFNAFNLCPFDKVKVVIIGQDPYHEPGQAQGLCFSVNDGIQFPPSLVNIFKEIENDCGTPVPQSGSLTRWAEQGVLLLNATLTVRAHQAGSHQRRGWEEFTDAAIKALSADKEHLVFILWGSYAQGKAEFIDRSKHLVLMSAHPSPLSAYRGFFGNRHFSRTNEYLAQNGETPILW